MMDSAMVNNHIFFQTKKGLLLEADKTFFKKKGLISQAEDGVKMELVYKFLSELIECRDYPGARIAHPKKKQIE